MVAAPATLSTDSPGGPRAIFWGGLIAGTLDITYAIVFSYLRSGTSPVVILQSVASGLLGKDSFNGGVCTTARRRDRKSKPLNSPLPSIPYCGIYLLKKLSPKSTGTLLTIPRSTSIHRATAR